MKYIRTKDGRIAEVKDNMFIKQSDVLRLVYKEKTYSCVLYGNDEIIKQADTIEELCDEFIVYQPWTNSYYLTKAQESIKANIQSNYYKGFGYENPIIYGAIWTDKGLIYVAKMNEKGELELL